MSMTVETLPALAGVFAGLPRRRSEARAWTF
ncbi:hypothetical protein SAMN04515678_105125 [Roseivivax sediminis]|uniref:Uncharacterized protein n=1 Tax=Roseivivax sediminis TaxID=936889 RepID=A0A1I1WXZ6_9RHOB|nr:hypothetical protein SAMN04515678_105125 [Roseivivax sediminis]